MKSRIMPILILLMLHNFLSSQVILEPHEEIRVIINKDGSIIIFLESKLEEPFLDIFNLNIPHIDKLESFSISTLIGVHTNLCLRYNCMDFSFEEAEEIGQITAQK